MNVLIDGIRYVPEPTLSTDTGLLAALEIRFDSDAGDNLTIHDYLRILLEKVWTEGECFNGKRPFGNSGWDFDLYAPLVKAGFIDGKLYEDGRIEHLANPQVAKAYVHDLIKAAFYGVDKYR